MDGLLSTPADFSHRASAGPPDAAALKAVEVQARDGEATDYDQWLTGKRGKFSCAAEEGAVVRSLRVNRSSRILDAGCGTGRLTMRLAPRVASVVAMDFSPQSISVLGRRLVECGVSNVTALVGDLNELSLPESSIDGAASVGVLHHVPTHALRVDALRRLRGVLRPGGRVVIVVYRWGGMIGADEPKEAVHSSGIYYHAFDSVELRGLFAEAGFRGVKVRGLISWPGRIRRYLPAWAAVFEPLMMAAPWSARVSDFLIAWAVK